MLTNPARIFPATERDTSKTEWFCSYLTFNFGRYFREGKEAFGDLYLLNDDELAGGRSLSMLIEQYSWVVLLPLAGAIKYKDSTGEEGLLEAGQVQFQLMKANSSFELINPFVDESVNCLQLWFRAVPVENIPQALTSTYSINQSNGKLATISPVALQDNELPFQLSIGKFAGGAQTIYRTTHQSAFAFVLEGTFETAGRLLQARDGLALTNVDEIAMEALGNDAVILLVDLPVVS